MAITEVRNNFAEAEKTVESTPNKQENTEKVYKNSKEYLEYLNSNYSCLQGSTDRSVTIAPGLLSQAAKDGKTRQWLEENLKLIPDVMDKIHQNTMSNGGRILSCNISFDGYDRMTTQVHSVYESDSGADKMKKTLEELRAKKKEQKEQEEKLIEKRERLRKQQIVTSNAENLLSEVSHIDFAKNKKAHGVTIDFKI